MTNTRTIRVIESRREDNLYEHFLEVPIDFPHDICDLSYEQADWLGEQVIQSDGKCISIFTDSSDIKRFEEA